MNHVRALWAAVALLAVYSVILSAALVVVATMANRPSELERCFANSTTEQEFGLCMMRARDH